METHLEQATETSATDSASPKRRNTATDENMISVEHMKQT